MVKHVDLPMSVVSFGNGVNTGPNWWRIWFILLSILSETLSNLDVASLIVDF
jgi:hypothetical protein